MTPEQTCGDAPPPVAGPTISLESVSEKTAQNAEDVHTALANLAGALARIDQLERTVAALTDARHSRTAFHEFT